MRTRGEVLTQIRNALDSKVGTPITDAFNIIDSYGEEVKSECAKLCDKQRDPAVNDNEDLVALNCAEAIRNLELP